MKRMRIGTRASTLAMIQTYQVIERLRQQWPDLKLNKQELDILTFTISSTVRNFMQWLSSCEGQTESSPLHLVTHNSQLKIACIGPIPSQTAREYGLPMHIEAQEFTIEGPVEAIVKASSNAC